MQRADSMAGTAHTAQEMSQTGIMVDVHSDIYALPSTMILQTVPDRQYLGARCFKRVADGLGGRHGLVPDCEVSSRMADSGIDWA
jgi:hypothetical protein